jgi:serine/threonine protein kinase
MISASSSSCPHSHHFISLIFQSQNYPPVTQLSTTGENILYVAINETTGELVVIKEPSNTQSLQTVVQANILNNISHPAIIALKDIMVIENGSAPILPSYPNGDLLNQITEFGSLSESDGKVIIFRILTALTCLHQNGIVHHDSKLEIFIWHARTSPMSFWQIWIGFSDV